MMEDELKEALMWLEYYASDEMPSDNGIQARRLKWHFLTQEKIIDDMLADVEHLQALLKSYKMTVGRAYQISGDEAQGTA